MAGTDAVILVGGLGTRLRPLTLSAPKPMLPTAGVPFLEHLISRLREAGITHVVLGTSYRAEVFESYFGDGSRFGVELECVVEREALGTGGGIRNVAGLPARGHRARLQRRQHDRRRPRRTSPTPTARPAPTSRCA